MGGFSPEEACLKDINCKIDGTVPNPLERCCQHTDAFPPNEDYCNWECSNWDFNSYSIGGCDDSGEMPSMPGGGGKLQIGNCTISIDVSSDPKNAAPVHHTIPEQNMADHIDWLLNGGKPYATCASDCSGAYKDCGLGGRNWDRFCQSLCAGGKTAEGISIMEGDR